MGRCRGQNGSLSHRHRPQYSDYPEFLVVAEAGDGPQAVELARQVQPDVVILDLMLPGLDGLQVVRTLRQVQPDTKVIALSARTELEVVELDISVHTVRNHRQRLMDKLDVHDTATLTRLAVDWGVLDEMWTEDWSTA